MMTEAIHTPFMSDRKLAIENARMVFNTMQNLSEEIYFKPNGIIQKRANEVLNKACNLLKEIEKIGLFTALEKGIFAGIKRKKDSGKGLEDVYIKEEGYFNIVLDEMIKELKGD